MATLVLGSIVTYKNDCYVALGYDGNLVTIIAPHRGQRKLRVKRGNVTVVNTSEPFILVAHHGDYLVRGYLGREDLPLPLIISLTTNRVMNWPDDNGNRREILRKAAEKFNRNAIQQWHDLNHIQSRPVNPSHYVKA
jgi:hypothetical protein